MLKIDQCKEEQKRLGIEADGMCAWFGCELAAVTVSLHSPDSKQSLLHTYTCHLHSKDTHITLQLQQQCDDVLHLQHLWVTSLVSNIPYASHVNTANIFSNGHSFNLTWLPIAAGPPSKDFTRFLISNDHESDESDTEEPKADGIDGMGQMLLVEALEEVGEGDDNDGEAQLSALGAAVWQTLVGMSIAMLKPLCSSSSEGRAYLQSLSQCWYSPFTSTSNIDNFLITMQHGGFAYHLL